MWYKLFISFFFTSSYMSIETEVQCAAIAADGEQCRRITRRGNMCVQHAKTELGLEVKESTIPGAGLGLFTTIDRGPGNNLCLYAGKRVNDPDFGNDYALTFKKGFHIDASETTSCFGRYANASRGTKLKANCQLVYDTRSQEGWLRVKPKVRIKAGTELLIGYGRTYWTARKPVPILETEPAEERLETGTRASAEFAAK
jgi:uncharacterized protein